MEGPFEERYKDLIVREVILFGDSQVQVNGHDIDGRKVWIMLHISELPEGISLSVFKPKDSYDAKVKVGANNLNHTLTEDCHDPDCELHHPEVIEDDAERLTAAAWFLAGAQEGLSHKRGESIKTILANHRLERNEP